MNIANVSLFYVFTTMPIEGVCHEIAPRLLLSKINVWIITLMSWLGAMKTYTFPAYTNKCMDNQMARCYENL